LIRPGFGRLSTRDKLFFDAVLAADADTRKPLRFRFEVAA